MIDYISREETLRVMCEACSARPACENEKCYSYGAVDNMPADDVVPWEFLERYADWFCALVSYPEFIREAKAFYKSTQAAMEGGNIGD